jgi:hypothetical protein
MTLRELIKEMVGSAGDIDEPVYVRIVTRREAPNGEIGDVLDGLTKMVKVSRLSFCDANKTILTVERSEFKKEGEE